MFDGVCCCTHLHLSPSLYTSLSPSGFGHPKRGRKRSNRGQEEDSPTRRCTQVQWQRPKQKCYLLGQALISVLHLSWIFVRACVCMRACMCGPPPWWVFDILVQGTPSACQPVCVNVHVFCKWKKLTWNESWRNELYRYNNTGICVRSSAQSLSEYHQTSNAVMVPGVIWQVMDTFPALLVFVLTLPPLVMTFPTASGAVIPQLLVSHIWALTLWFQTLLESCLCLQTWVFDHTNSVYEFWFKVEFGFNKPTLAQSLWSFFITVRSTVRVESLEAVLRSCFRASRVIGLRVVLRKSKSYCRSNSLYTNKLIKIWRNVMWL